MGQNERMLLIHNTEVSNLDHSISMIRATETQLRAAQLHPYNGLGLTLQVPGHGSTIIKKVVNHPPI